MSKFNRTKSSGRSRVRRAVFETLESRQMMTTAVDTPYTGTAFAPSATILAVNYDKGGEGVSYHDTTAKNLGNSSYRPNDAVDIETGGTTNRVVGYTAAGEWLNYTVKIATAGKYVLQVSAANVLPGATVHAGIGTSNLSGEIAVQSSTGWQTYHTSSSAAFSLSAGTQIIRLTLDHVAANGAIGNIDWIKLVPQTSAPVATETPYLGAAFATNQTIPAADYDLGGEGVAYHDTTVANLGGDNLRPGDHVDIQAGGATGNIIGYTVAGEWLDYTINVATAGNYTLSASVTNAAAGGTFHASIGSTNITGTMTVPNNGNWTTYSTVKSISFPLTAGTHVLRINMDHGASNTAIGDFDWFQIVPASSPVITPITPLVWTTAHNATEGLAEAKSVGVNGKLYVFGGYYTTTPEYQATTSSEAYDPATDKWALLAPLPVPTTHMGIATDGKYIYIVGGYTYNPKTTWQTFGTTNSWRYDIANNTWSAYVPLPSPRGAGDMEYLNGYLHFFDGLLPPNKTPETTHWMLDVNSANPQWVVSTPTPFSRNHFSAAVLNGKIYLMGGRSLGDDIADPSAECIVWDPANPGVWSSIASLPQIRALAVSAVIDGKIFLAGGTTKSYTPIDTVIEYDPTTNKWSNQTPIPATRLAPCGGAVGNLLVITTGLSQTLQSSTWVARVG